MKVGEGRSCISIDRDHGQSVVGALGSELGLSGRERPHSGKDLGEVEVLEWWNVARTEDVFGTEGGSGVAEAPG